MNNDQHAASHFPAALFAPLTHWASGFEYAFGYQLKLIREFWGLSDED